MRDLYKRIGARYFATNEEITHAINSYDGPFQQDKIDASHILVDKELKGIYDRANQTLHFLGQLRSNLDSYSGDFWNSEDLSDYIHSKNVIYVKSVNNKNNKFGENRKVIIISIIAIAFFGYLILGNNSKQSGSQNINNGQENIRNDQAQNSSVDVDSLLTEIKFPNSGSYSNLSGKKRLAPLEIKSSGNDKYFIKLVDSLTGKDKFLIYVNNGETVNIDVPIGSYKFRYATGEKWYGVDNLFGQKTYCTEAESIFDFRQENGEVTGYTITLYKVRNGNLSTKNIPRSNF